MRYRVCVTETVGGFIEVDTDGDNKIFSEPYEVTDEASAEAFVEQLIEEHGNEKIEKVTHREVDTCGVDVL